MEIANRSRCYLNELHEPGKMCRKKIRCTLFGRALRYQEDRVTQHSMSRQIGVGLLLAEGWLPDGCELLVVNFRR